MNTQKKINQVLDYVCSLTGETEMPVRTSFELAASLQRFFKALEQKEQKENGHL